MAALSAIDYASGADTMQEAFDKTNLIKDAANNITAQNTLATKVINIGDWNMDSTANISVAHGLTLANIRIVDVMIRNDANTQYYSTASRIGSGAHNFLNFTDATNINLFREASSDFDSTDFDSTGYNRGFITITYTI